MENCWKVQDGDIPQAGPYRRVHGRRVASLEMRDLLCRVGGLGLRQRTSSGQNAALGRYAVGPIPPTCCEAGRITKWVGFHTFRHTYSTLLKANGKDVKVVQELMRHANISTTMNIYTKALTQPSGRLKAGWSTFFWVDRGKPRRVQHENQRIESVSRLFCESAKLLV